MSDIIELDARRLFCPLPVIRQQPAGTRVRIVATDPGSMNDIPQWCRISGHEVLESEECGDEFVFLVRKGAEQH